MFGAGSSGFGGFSQQTPQQQTGLFGQPQQQQQQQQQPAFGGFTSSQAPASGSIFGNPQQQQQQQIGFGGFGNSASQAQGAFGQPQAQQTAFGTFGAVGQSSTPFGQATSQAPANYPFGQPALSQAPLGGFGFPQQPAQPGFGASLFGGEAAPTNFSGAGAFGPGVGGFGVPQQQQQLIQHEDWKNPRDVDTAQRVVRSHYPKDMFDQLWITKQMWDPASKFFIFRHYLLNFVQPSEVRLYQPSENDYMFGWLEKKKSISEDLADKAVPVQIFGFEGLDKRCKQQQENNAIHARQVQNLESRVGKIKNHHFLDTIMRLTAYQRKNAELASRIARLMAYTQILRNRSTSIKPEEESFKARVEAANKRLEQETQIRARIMELHTHIEHVRDNKMDASVANGANNIISAEGAIAGDVDRLKDVLQDHESWLASLSEIVRKDAEDVHKIVGDYAEIFTPNTSSST